MASSVRVEALRTAGGRRRFTLVAEQRLARPPAELFPFFADAHNLERITPPWLHFRVLTPRPIAMAEGTLIAYRLRLHGVPLWWLTRIAAWDPPHGFVDEQLRGPYRLWRHRHTFEADGDGTLALDRVDYELRGRRPLPGRRPAAAGRSRPDGGSSATAASGWPSCSVSSPT